MAAMATMDLAMWLQAPEIAGNRQLIFIFMGLVAVAILGMAAVFVLFAVKALQAIKTMTQTADELKAKLIPLLDEAMALSKSGREILVDAAPKVKIITENLLQTSRAVSETGAIARTAAQQIDSTVTDANRRAQRQVARVDGMISAALTTTAEVAEAIGNGIRVPVQQVAVIATQVRTVAEGLFAKVRSMTGAGSKTTVEATRPPIH